MSDTNHAEGIAVALQHLHALKSATRDAATTKQIADFPAALVLTLVDAAFNVWSWYRQRSPFRWSICRNVPRARFRKRWTNAVSTSKRCPTC